MSEIRAVPPKEILRHVVDAHCHPTDSETPDVIMEALNIHICAMATRTDDQLKVKALADAWPEKVTPCFGYHPWSSHTISLAESPPRKLDHYKSLFITGLPSAEQSLALEEVLQYLPEPRPLAAILIELRGHLSAYPRAMLGEVGLDRAFRVPFRPYPSPPPRNLTPFTVPLEHQLSILEAQLALAVEFGRNVSLHSVKSQGATVALLGRMRAKHGAAWNEINIDFHSCGLSAETWKQVERYNSNAYLSLSIVINGRSPGFRGLMQACSPRRILVESDYNQISMCTTRTWEMVLALAEVKGWTVEERWEEASEIEPGVVKRLEQNWTQFLHRTSAVKATEDTRRIEGTNNDETSAFIRTKAEI